MAKTNAIRLLEAQKINHTIHEYEFSEDEIDAVSVAKKVNASPETVFKTLVARNENPEVLVFCIPGNYDLDLKKAAGESGSKKIELIKVKEIKELTGYIRGGTSPLGMKKDYSTFIDESAQLFEEIFVSAGIRGTQVKLSPTDLSKITSAKFADLV